METITYFVNFFKDNGLDGSAALLVAAAIVAFVAISKWVIKSVASAVAGASADSVVANLLGSSVGNVEKQSERLAFLDKVDRLSPCFSGSLLKHGVNDIARREARRLARRSVRRALSSWARLSLGLVVLTVLLWLLMSLFPICAARFISDPDQILGSVIPGLLLLLIILCFIFWVTSVFLLAATCSNFPELKAKGEAVIVRKKIKDICKERGLPRWHAISLSGKSLKLLVESSESWCLVRAESERGPLGMRLAGSIEVSDLAGEVLSRLPDDTRFFVYSDYGLKGAQGAKELLEKGYDAYVVDAVFDDATLWGRLAVELDILQGLGLIPARISVEKLARE